MLCFVSVFCACQFASMLVMEIEPGVLHRDAPRGWWYIAGHGLRAVISGFLAEALGRYLWALRCWRDAPDLGHAKIVVAMARWWRRFAIGIMLMLMHQAWWWISISIPSDPYQAYRYQQPEGLPTVKVQFYIAEDQPGEGLRRELLPDVGLVVYRENEPFLSNIDLAHVKATVDSEGQPALGMVLTKDGAMTMREKTRHESSQHILLMIDDKPTTAPYIRGEIGDSLMITGNFTKEEVERIAAGAIGRK
jgi:hypothetical protein